MPPKRKRDMTPDDLESEPDDLETDPDAVEPLPDAVETVPDSEEKLPDAKEGLSEAVISAMTAKQFPDRNLREQLAIRYQMLSDYEAGNGPTIAAKTINDMFGKRTITQASCSRWFKRFREGNTNLVGASTRIWSQNESEANEVFRKLESEAQELHGQVLQAYAAKKKAGKAAKKKTENAVKKKKAEEQL
ncbi:hypothetical protein DdX_15035 [Ditylenchus destructor]|uniref:Mos1 transposase HTH domain-containing protein n=1 Tax=Ditylenchus destructor TaxID=166010 RepID=A0AAD4MRN5_9BILA|nr:hypothetical protein DdX_15035 [Ditylenchus destructor]